MFGFEFNIWTVALITALVIGISWNWWKKRQYYNTYWERRGVFTAPYPGIIALIKIFYKGDFFEVARKNYSAYGRIYGTFEKTTPVISIGKPELLKDILVKDFNVFHFRRDLQQGDPISDNMVSVLKGEDWKRVRTIITPAFTSKRMRLMSSIINECSKSVVKLCEDHFRRGVPVDCKALFGSYTMDVIARAAFGTKIDSVSDPGNAFVAAARNTFLKTTGLRILLFILTPTWLLKKFRFFSLKEANFFRDVTLQVIKERKETGKRYDDVLQILMDAAEEDAGNEDADVEDETDRFGSITHTDGQKSSVKYRSLSEDELLAQCVLFFFVGYETTASTLTFMSYCFALNPEWQERVIEEVDEAFRKHREMSYDSVRDMKLLDAFMSETLRMYPILSVTERTSAQDYELRDTGIHLEKGTRVVIPIYGLHYDEEYFPDPDTFNPNRFMDASADSSVMQYAYMPFGVGPRNCLGMRFALMEIKLVVANILRNFRFRRHFSTKVPIQFKMGSPFLSVNEMPLAVEKRTDAPQ